MPPSLESACVSPTLRATEHGEQWRSTSRDGRPTTRHKTAHTGRPIVRPPGAVAISAADVGRAPRRDSAGYRAGCSADDGSYDVGHSRSQADLELGSWSVDGDVLTQLTDADSNACAGVPGVYRSEMSDDGDRFVATAQDDTCNARIGDFTTLTRMPDSDS